MEIKPDLVITAVGFGSYKIGPFVVFTATVLNSLRVLSLSLSLSPSLKVHNNHSVTASTVLLVVLPHTTQHNTALLSKTLSFFSHAVSFLTETFVDRRK